MPLKSTAGLDTLGSGSALYANQCAFDTLWEGALLRYTRETGKDILAHPFSNDLLDSSLSPDAVVHYIDEQNQAFETFRASGRRILRVLHPIVRVVCLFIDVGAEGAAASNVVPGGKAIFVAVGVLLQAAKGVSELYDAIELLFKEVNACLARVTVYLASPTPPSSTLMDILLRTFVQIFVILGIVTKYCYQATVRNSKPKAKKGARAFLQRMKDYFRGILGHADVKGALEELAELTKEEYLLVAADTNRSVRNAQPQVQFIYDKAVVSDLRSWLGPLNPKPANYEMKRRTGSCEWFFDARFEDWKARANGVFWVHGNAGSGKSILCSSIIDQLQADTTLQLFYFYFDSSDATKRDCLGLISSLVFQLGTSRSECFHYLYGQREKGQQECLLNDHPTFEVLFAMLSRLLRISGRTYLILDALDECPDYARHNGLLEFLNKICTLEGDTIRLLVTSRREPAIYRTMSRLATHSLSFHDDDQHKDDLKRHIHIQLSKREPYCQWPDSIKQKAQHVLFEKSNGMFLWVNLQLRDLISCAPHDVERALDELPFDLYETYQRILTKFPANPVMIRRARHVFECIAFAQRPLSLAEVVQLFFMNIDTPSHNPIVLNLETTSVTDPEIFVLERCPSFLDIVVSKEGDKTVQFVHFSVREYLMSPELQQLSTTIRQYGFDECSANITLARICLSALDAADSPSRFLSYANEHWQHHVSSRNESDLGNLLSHFLRLDSPTFTRWARIRSDFLGYSGTNTALHVAAGLGLCRLVTEILETSRTNTVFDAHTLVHARGLAGRTALHIAAFNGRAAVSRILLEHGALVDDIDENGCIPLHWAAENGHLGVLSVLLEHPMADTMQCHVRRADGGETALHGAAENGHADICRLLLENGAVVNDMDSEGGIPLHLAACNGHLDVARVLLSYPAINGSDAAAQCRAKCTGHGYTALHDAAENGHAEICRLLLENGAVANDMDSEGRLPLHLTACNGHLDVARVLLSCPATNGLDAETQCRARCTDHGFTALHDAAENGHAEICRLLLANGAIVNDMDSEGRIPLHLAVCNGHLDVVRVLLGYPITKGSGATVQCRSKCTDTGTTALHDAAEQGHAEICRLLLENGAVVDDTNSVGSIPLHIAASNGHLDVVRILLSRPATDGSGAAAQCLARRTSVSTTALHDAAQHGHAEICRLLLENGAVINAANDLGSLPLHLAALGGHLDAVRVLLDRPAMDGLDAAAQCRAKRTDTGATALHVAAEQGHTEICRLLLENGAVVDDTNSVGSIPLHIAASNGHLDVVRVLLSLPAMDGPGAAAQCLARRTSVSTTALHDAAQHGHAEICRLLLENGAVSNAANDLGSLPLHLAALGGHLDVVRVLLSRPVTDESGAAAQCRARRTYSRTALHDAASKGHAGVARLLLTHGALVADVDDNDSTPLHLGAYDGHLDVARVLLDFHTDAAALCRARKKDGMTALHDAAYRGHAEVCRLLLDHGAVSGDEADNSGNTPVYYAEKNGHADVVRILSEQRTIVAPHVASSEPAPMSA